MRGNELSKLGDLRGTEEILDLWGLDEHKYIETY